VNLVMVCRGLSKLKQHSQCVEGKDGNDEQVVAREMTRVIGYPLHISSDTLRIIHLAHRSGLVDILRAGELTMIELLFSP